MRVRVLGPLEVAEGDDGRRQSAGPALQRSVLAALVVERWRPVSMDRLTEQLWPQGPPRGALNQIQGYVMRLRRRLGDRNGTLLRTQSPGYALILEPDQLDLTRFERAVERGMAALRAGEHESAAGLLAGALGLWRGAVLADVAETPAIGVEAARLEELRSVALEARIDADLALGRHESVLHEVGALVRAAPLREHFWGQLMLALYRTGGQAEALDCYQRLYRILDEEIGTTPGREIQRLHTRILEADPGLDLPSLERTGRERSAVRRGAASTRASASDAVTGAEAKGDPDALPDDAAGGRALVPRQLPAMIGDFTGRGGYLRRLDDCRSSATSSPIVLLTGMGGVGKTALALCWAHAITGDFPDGQLHVDLHGYAEVEPLRPLEVLERFLRALGVDATAVPMNVDVAAAMFRSAVAGRRMLILLDNAVSADQVEPVLPAGDGHLTVVTSRDALGRLVVRQAAARIEVGELEPSESSALLRRLLGPERFDAETEAAADLARCCGHLPLALRIAAADLSGRPTRRVADAAAELTDSGRQGELGDAGGAGSIGRLDRLRLADDPATAVEAVFDLSYRRLSDEERRCFRLLGLVPGPDVTADALAALAGIDPVEADRMLARLTGHHLLHRTTSERYGLHDLLRVYAQACCARDETGQRRRAAKAGLSSWHIDATLNAARGAVPDYVPFLPDLAERLPEQSGFDNLAAAWEWLEEERPNLIAAVRQAVSTDPVAACMLADALRPFLRAAWYHNDWLTVAELGRRAADDLDDIRGRAAFEVGLAQASRHLRNQAGVEQHGAQGASLATTADWPEGVSLALNEVASDRLERGRPDQAIGPLHRALAFSRRSEDTAGRSASLLILGAANHMAGDLLGAVECAGESAALARETRQPRREAIANTNLVNNCRLLGRWDAAREHGEHGLRISREHQFPYGECALLLNLAELELDAGDLRRAQEYVETASAMTDRIDYPRIEIQLLLANSRNQLRAGDLDAALRACEEAGRMTGRSDIPYEDAEYLILLGEVHLRRSELVAARQVAQDAFDALRSIGFKILHALARTGLARVLLATDEPEPAGALVAPAVRMLNESRYPLAEARALRTLASANEHLADLRAAAEHRRCADEILTTLGAPVCDE